MKKLIITNLFFLSAIIFAQIDGKIIKVKDGDTVIVLYGNKITKVLRLADVDCPESGQPFGKNAKQFTSDQVFGKTISFVETNTDRYGRTIAKVYYDNGKYLSEEIIKNGFGWWYYRYSNRNEFALLEKTAIDNKIGLWTHPNPLPPWVWRHLNKTK